MITNRVKRIINKSQEYGIYIFFSNNSYIFLNKKEIERESMEYWKNKTLAAKIKKYNFTRCDFCPLFGKKSFCNALRPVLPMIKKLDKFSSIERVDVVYKLPDDNVLCKVDVCVSEALRSIALMCLVNYCIKGRNYSNYFYGIKSYMNFEEISERIFLNIYWQNNENLLDDEVKEFVNLFYRITRNQLLRLLSICKSDSLTNALVSLQSLITIVSLNMESLMVKRSNNDFIDIFFN